MFTFHSDPKLALWLLCIYLEIVENAIEAIEAEFGPLTMADMVRFTGISVGEGAHEAQAILSLPSIFDLNLAGPGLRSKMGDN